MNNFLIKTRKIKLKNYNLQVMNVSVEVEHVGMSLKTEPAYLHETRPWNNEFFFFFFNYI